MMSFFAPEMPPFAPMEFDLLLFLEIAVLLADLLPPLAIPLVEMMLDAFTSPEENLSAPKFIALLFLSKENSTFLWMPSPPSIEMISTL